MGPVHIACGNISPAKTIKKTEIRIAKAGGTTLSKKMGNDSIHKALATNNVQSNIWCCYKIGNIIAALF